MACVLRIIPRADEWFIELDGDYFGPCRSHDEALRQASAGALRLRLEAPGADVRIEQRPFGEATYKPALRKLTEAAQALGFRLTTTEALSAMAQ